MPNRAPDWLSQAGADLEHARHSLQAGDFEWACFAAQQSAEKATKALIMSLGGEGWGHSVTRLLADVRRLMEVPEELLSASKRLDRHYIPARYPNGFDIGAPKDYYTAEDAERAIADAESIHDFCQQCFRQP
jgi:HEPN domain-containing protein